MPCYYRIFPEEGFVASVYFGRVTAACILELLDSLEADLRYDEDMRSFDDLSRIEVLALSSIDIANFAAMLSGFSARRHLPDRRALFAPNGPGRAAALKFQQLVEGCSTLQVGVFDTASPALEFLGAKSSARLEQLSAADCGWLAGDLVQQ